MSIVIHHVDAFTHRPFAGNPAAVCVLNDPRDRRWMQSVAAEMNLSETAFLILQDDSFELRWFTPTTEVDLCGHATLASAHVLWERGLLNGDQQARFDTLSGRLTAIRHGEWIEMDFPSEPAESCEAPPAMIEALGGQPRYVGKNRLDYLVELSSEDALRDLEPDYRLLKKVSMRGLIVTARATGGRFDFLSRYFAPSFGIDEDPVTGSSHCCLGPYWEERLGRNELLGYQASTRGGVVRVRTKGDRVIIGGQAVTVMRSELVEPVPIQG